MSHARKLQRGTLSRGPISKRLEGMTKTRIWRALLTSLPFHCADSCADRE
jgi:hypothetical protein